MPILNNSKTPIITLPAEWGSALKRIRCGPRRATADIGRERAPHVDVENFRVPDATAMIVALPKIVRVHIPTGGRKRQVKRAAVIQNVSGLRA